MDGSIAGDPRSTLLVGAGRASVADPLQQELLTRGIEGSKPSNPKDGIGSTKLPLHLWPTTATVYGSMGLLVGALKYGRSNFRALGARASIYYDACRRHMDAWFEGEELDPETGISHLCLALSCIAILVECIEAGNLTDDRAYPTNYRAMVDRFTPDVARLQALFADRVVKHYDVTTPTKEAEHA